MCAEISFLLGITFLLFLENNAPPATMPEPLSQHVAWDLVTVDLLQADRQANDQIQSDKLALTSLPVFTLEWCMPLDPPSCVMSPSWVICCYISPSSAMTAYLNDSELCLPWSTNQCFPGVTFYLLCWSQDNPIAHPGLFPNLPLIVAASPLTLVPSKLMSSHLCTKPQSQLKHTLQ